MIRVIINADDLGMSPLVNQKIEEALENDYISSSTILANTDYMKDVKRIVAKYEGRKSFGVHLNITEGPSLTNSPVLREAGMIDGEGRFVKEHNKSMRHFEEPLREAIRQEWDLQVSRVLEAGVPVSHLDGHHHCHTWYGLSESLRAVMDKYGISKVRNTYTSPFMSEKDRVEGIVARFALLSRLMDASKSRSNSRVVVSLRSYQDKLHYEKATLRYGKTDYFEQYETLYYVLNGQNLAKITSHSSTVSIELMCHPGHPNYIDEYTLIKSDSIGVRNNPDVVMINYNEL